MSRHAVAPSQARPAPAVPARSFTPARSLLLQRKCACPGGAASCESCQKEDSKKKQQETAQKLQRSASTASAPTTAPPIVNSVLSSPGRPLDAPVRSSMEQGFGRDFSGVRIHTDPVAAESARAVNAHAYTVGNHIAFDQGKYDPQSHAGQRLLAHELTHTVQQHGLQRYSDDLPLAGGSESRHLEREADAAAASVMSGAHAPSLSSRPAHAVISRAEKAREWEPIAKDDDLRKLKPPVTRKAKPGADVEPGIMAFAYDTLDLPSDKGPVLDMWDSRAKAGALEATLKKGETTQAALKQGRPNTDTLRSIWLKKVHWDPKEADANWGAAGGKPASFDPPKAGGHTCQVDHIVELQFGGGNNPENLQMLDAAENQSSGATLFAMLKQRADDIREVLTAQDSKSVPENILLHFDKVVQKSADCEPCCKVEANAVGGGKAAKVEDEGQPYPISAGGTETEVRIPDELAKNKKPVPIRNSEIARNKAASTLIAGLLLDTLHRKAPGSDTIDAVMDSGTKTRLPETLDKEKPVTLNVAKDGKLTLPKARRNLRFHYPYLSEGAFTDLKLEEGGTLSGSGSIKPTVAFLPEFKVEFNKDTFRLAAPIKKPKLPIPGAKITEAEIGLELAPEFKAYGKLGFELAPGNKKVMDAALDISADTSGLVADGLIHVFLPGVDNAEGHLTYRDHEWSGGVKIETSQLQNKLKYVKSGGVEVTIIKGHLAATGTVSLDIPHTEGVEASLHYERERWVFKGKGTFNPPRLKPVTIAIEYDGTHIEGMAETEFEFQGLKGKIKVLYRDEHFSGEGTIEIKKGRAEGTLHVKMHPGPKFSGEGELKYQISENLIGKAGIVVDEQEHVRFKGALEFPKPIPLFKPFGDDYEFFKVGIEIPIPGASIGPIGLKATIKGSLSAGYQIGPGELRNAKIEAAFNPLDDNPDLDVEVSAQLYIGASAHVTGKISGGVEVSIGIASVGGNLTITATATLGGHVASKAKIHYTKSRLEVEADFEALLALAIDLALEACVTAEAGVWRFKVSTEKCWTLAKYHYDPGLSLGLKLKKPLRYASDEGFQFPSVNDFEWITPTLDPEDVLKKTFSNAGTKEDEK
jgi:hypothetical protein